MRIALSIITFILSDKYLSAILVQLLRELSKRTTFTEVDDKVVDYLESKVKVK